MFNQFCLTGEHSGYWIDEKVGRKALLGKEKDAGQVLEYQGYRWVHRRIAMSTNTRTMISTIVVGLEPDLQTLRKRDRDGYELFLTDLLLIVLGKDLASCLRVSFHSYDGRDVCRVTIAKSPKPVYLQEGNDEVFYLRTGNSTRRLSTRETVEYARHRWG